jgi:hypothetical protein
MCRDQHIADFFGDLQELAHSLEQKLGDTLQSTFVKDQDGNSVLQPMPELTTHQMRVFREVAVKGLESVGVGLAALHSGRKLDHASVFNKVSCSYLRTNLVFCFNHLCAHTSS